MKAIAIVEESIGKVCCVFSYRVVVQNNKCGIEVTIAYFCAIVCPVDTVEVPLGDWYINSICLDSKTI